MQQSIEGYQRSLQITQNRYDVGVDANACAPVSLDELRVWFSGVGEPCGRVKWPWWVNQTGDRQVERELAAYKRERAN